MTSPSSPHPETCTTMPSEEMPRSRSPSAGTDTRTQVPAVQTPGDVASATTGAAHPLDEKLAAGILSSRPSTPPAAPKERIFAADENDHFIANAITHAAGCDETQEDLNALSEAPRRESPLEKETEASVRLESADLSMIDGLYYLDKESYGNGGEAWVYRGRCLRTEEPVAVKIVDDPISKLSGLAKRSKEIKIMRKFMGGKGHANLVQVMFAKEKWKHDEVANEKKLSRILVMEVMEGTLEGVLGQREENGRFCTEADIKHVSRNALMGLLRIHDEGYVHCDVKGPNLLVKHKLDDILSLEIKVADLGAAISLNDATAFEHRSGSPYYRAPGEANTPEVMAKTDIWPVALLCAQGMLGRTEMMRLGEQYPSVETWNKARVNILEALSEKVSKPGLALLGRMLQTDPQDRPSARECLNDPWLWVEGRSILPSPMVTSTPLHTCEPATVPITPKKKRKATQETADEPETTPKAKRHSARLEAAGNQPPGAGPSCTPKSTSRRRSGKSNRPAVENPSERSEEPSPSKRQKTIHD